MGPMKIIDAGELNVSRRDPVDPQAMKIALEVVEDVRAGGEEALRRYAERFGEVRQGGRLFYSREELDRSLVSLERAERELIARVAERIRAFAAAQRESVKPFEFPIPGGMAGQEIAPVHSAGCYAPGGRFPLPSSVLMTAVTARAAGVSEVWVASPKPTAMVMAAAAASGADGLLAAGGAQAIAAMAYGAGPMPACDFIAGPGNKYVTAAKKAVLGRVGIDMLAGPSELVVLADSAADPELAAADLLAQAEHDPDAAPILVTTDRGFADEVLRQIRLQIEKLPTKETAQGALANGFVLIASDMREAIEACDRIAPEHLELMVDDAGSVAAKLSNYGAIFIGSAAAEVLGDYGAGPNHTLPTGGSSRYTGGLSVVNFLRFRTWMRIDDPALARGMIEDAAFLGRIEGLAGHAVSAKLRIQR